jgi:hypothetical protein
VALGAAVIAAGTLLLLRNTTTPIDALDLEVSVSGESLGDFGWYRYATEGFEEVDALQGGRHDYPGDSYLTLQPGECGEVVRWQPIAERWQEWHWCDGVIVGERAYHEWFGVPDEETASCTGGEDYRTAGVGSAWTTVCTRDRSVSTATITNLGPEEITVAGAGVAAIHLAYEEVTEGETVGTTTADLWLHPRSPLVLRWSHEDDSATTSRIGDVGYTERLTIELATPDPGS